MFGQLLRVDDIILIILVRGVKLGKTSPIAGLGVDDGVLWDIGVAFKQKRGVFFVFVCCVGGLGLKVVSERYTSKYESMSYRFGRSRRWQVEPFTFLPGDFIVGRFHHTHLHLCVHGR